MNRALFSGVAGMKAHQTKMDVIGNNISNVNTYGYKSQRAVFSDIYYQTLRGASAGTGTRGGQNPSMIGYGSALLGVQSQMTQSSTQNTGFGLDVAIAGDGYLQVMDPDGNIFYTKAGMLDYDSNGYLTDINGNFVLGTSATGKPGSEKIRLDNVGSVPPSQPSVTQDINSVKYTITGSNFANAGNVSISIRSGDDLPVGQKAKATLSGNTIDIKLNGNENFGSLADLNEAINNAITEANNGVQHAGGYFTISGNPAPNFGDGMTGKEIAGTTFGYKPGSIGLPSEGIFGGFKIASVGNDFSVGTNNLNFSVTRVPGTDSKGDAFTVTATSGTKTYTGTIYQNQMGVAGQLVLKNDGSTTDSITVTFPNYSNLISSANFTANSWDSFPYSSTTLTDAERLTELNKAIKDGTFFGGFTGSLPDDLFTPTPTNTADPILTCVDPTAADPTFKLTVGDYTATFKKSECGKSVDFVGDNTKAGKSFQMKVPSFDNMLSAGNANITFADPNSTVANNKIVNSEKSKDMGLSSLTFTLSGGTEGGLVSLDKLTSISIGADGTVTVSNPEKGTVIVGRITLANFANPNGLAQAGTNYFKSTVNSGDAQLADPGSDGTGGLKSSSLEMSNVDLSQEFADMITTQRGFQANSRIITVSDTMLEELINLKR